MAKLFNFIFLLGIGFWCAGLLADTSERLTLDSATETAQKNNPDIHKLELAADSTGWAKTEALAEHLLHLDVRGTHFLGAKYMKLGILFGGNAIEFPTGFPQTDFNLEASLLLFDGLGSINRYRAAISENLAAQLEFSRAKFLLDEQILVKFYQALAARELVVVADQNIQTLEQHLKLAEASKKAGFSTNVDVLRIESLLEEARADKILAVDNVTISRHALGDAMGVENDERSISGDLPIPNKKKVPEDLKLDLSKREDVEAQTRREEAQDRRNAAAAAFWFPKISAFGVEEFYRFGEFDPVILPNASYQNAYAFGLRFTWNLFDGGASIARKAQADDAAKIAAENSRKLLIHSPSDFDLWKRRYLYNAALFEARTRSVEKSTESVRLATLAVKAGTKTHSEALDAELELFRARAGLVRAQVDAVEALANLELALGRRL